MKTEDGYVCDNCGQPVMATTAQEDDGSLYCEACKAKLRQPEAQDFPVPASAPQVEEYAELIQTIEGLLKFGSGRERDSHLDEALESAIAAIRKLCQQCDSGARDIQQLRQQRDSDCRDIDRLHACLRQGELRLLDMEKQRDRLLEPAVQAKLQEPPPPIVLEPSGASVPAKTCLLVERQAHTETLRQRDILAAGLRRIASYRYGGTETNDEMAMVNIAGKALREAGMAEADDGEG